MRHDRGEIGVLHAAQQLRRIDGARGACGPASARMHFGARKPRADGQREAVIGRRRRAMSA